MDQMDQKRRTLINTKIAGEWMSIPPNALKDLKGIDSSAYSAIFGSWHYQITYGHLHEMQPQMIHVNVMF